MIPGVNPKQMQSMMKKMGIQQQEIDAYEVIIKCEDKTIIISQPQVSKVNMMGQETFQIVGHPREEEIDTTPEITEDDIETVTDQTGCSPEEAEAALKDKKGDLAEAILELKKD
jgi:nascent polypeptide-associated complex subunit alpha